MTTVPDPVPLVDPARRFVLFTNGKCGGTTLKSWFFANLDLPGFERRPLRFLATFGPRYVYRHFRTGRRLTPRDGRPTDLDRVRRMTNFYRRVFCAPAVASGATAGYFNVAVVRHPEDRVVSAFLDKFCGEDRGEPWVRRAAEAAHPDGDPSFADFLGYLETEDERRCDPHWRRQSYALDGHAIDAFVRLERLAEDFDAIADRVGRARLDRLGAKLQRSAVPRAAPAHVDDMSRLRASQIVARRAAEGDFPPKEAFLTDETRARIARIYARDFATLPYGPPSAQIGDGQQRVEPDPVEVRG